MKRFFCVVAAIVPVILLAACGETAPPTPVFVEATRAIPQTMPSEITARGVVESVERRSVYSTLGLTVETVYVEAGDEVTAGQVLARLDTSDLEIALRQQRADLEIMRQMATLSPRQQQAELRAIREASTNAVDLSRRLFDEARENLENNSNMHIIGAEAAVTSAELHLTSMRRNYEIARGDFAARSNPHVMAAESALASARLQLETQERDFDRFTLLYEAGGLARNELRQMETALEHAQNAYADANTNLANAEEAERRALEDLSRALSAAVSTHADATTMLDTTRLAAEQELEMHRSNLATAEIAANMEPLEIAVNMAALEIASGLENLETAILLTERQLEDAVITAPISGTVTAAIAREGAMGAGLMFIVEDVENLRIITRLREYDIALVAPGMAAQITADATGTAAHSGEIRRINPAAVHDSPIVEFEVEVTIPPDTGLRIGMNARILIELE